MPKRTQTSTNCHSHDVPVLCKKTQKVSSAFCASLLVAIRKFLDVQAEHSFLGLLLVRTFLVKSLFFSGTHTSVLADGIREDRSCQFLL